jgi:hypothetical protein
MDFSLGEIIPALETMMERMHRIGERVYLDLRPNECFCIIMEDLPRIIEAIEVLARLSKLFGCPEINIIITMHGGAAAGKEFKEVPIREDGYFNMENCSNVPKINGIRWIQVNDYELTKNSCVWGSLKKTK